MNSPVRFFYTFLFAMIFFMRVPAVLSQTVYIDPSNGDNRNPGVSSTTARKSTANVSGQHTHVDMETGARAYRKAQADVKASSTTSARAAVELQRIILGPEIIAGWDAFAPTIWQAPLELDQNLRLEAITVGDTRFENGCAADFIGDRQFYWQSGTLFINDPVGNPDNSGKTVTVQIYNSQTDDLVTSHVTGWSACPPAVWQAGLQTEPIHVFVDDMLFDPNTWWGPQYCEANTGQPDMLYVRDTQGNPDTNAKTVAAVINTGGWAVTSGDFNGDGLADVVHSNSGAHIYINYGAPEFLASPGQTLTSPEDWAMFGSYVVSAGDVNNDGFEELIVSMGWDAGSVYLYMGSESGLDESSGRIISAPEGYPAFGFGHGIAGRGNINGDDYSDILIMGGDDSLAYLCIYLGSAEGILPQPDSIIAFPGKVYGGSVCIAGDMNRDGFDDVAISMASAPPSDTIEVHVYYGSADAKLSNPLILEIAVPEKDTTIKAEVAPAGDVNLDGFADLVVGNQWALGDNENEGKAYIFLGGASGPSQAPDFIFDNPIPEYNARFGAGVSGIGDIDRDGYGDIAIGCPYGREGKGFVAIYGGSAAGISTIPMRTIEGVDQFGWSISGVGDLKGIEQSFLIAGEEFGGAYLYARPCDILYYVDADGDGYGDAGSTNPSCIQHPGYVADNTDPDDTNPQIQPGAAQVAPDNPNDGNSETGNSSENESSGGNDGNSDTSGCFIAILKQ